MISLLLGFVLLVLNSGGAHNVKEVQVIPPKPSYSPEVTSVEREYNDFLESYLDHYEDGLYVFDRLFNSYEVKRTKNNRLMIRQGNSGSFKFVKKG